MAFNYSPRVVTDGLVLYLDAANQYSYVSGSTSWNDISRGGNNGTLVNGPTYSSANGGSIVFDGTNDYSDINNSSLPSGSGSHTLSTWIFKQGDNTSNGWVSLATWGTNNNNQKRMIFVSSQSSLGNKIYTGFYNNDYNWGTGITNNVWTHLSWIFDGSTEAIYLNGVLYGIHAVSSVNTVLGVNHSIGGYFDGTFISYYNGRISNFSIYNRALSATEVLQNYNATKTRFGL
jgi:hypothetical protein